jgi:uncharacterized protein YdhG (YjbR/CyaY superfamily)
MVQSSAATVDAWLDERAPERRPVFERLRAECVAALPGWVEAMGWGMPAYGPPGAAFSVAFNDQKRHIALYAGTTAVTTFADRLSGVDCGKGCVRYRRPEQIDWDVLRAMLADIRVRAEPMA